MTCLWRNVASHGESTFLLGSGERVGGIEVYELELKSATSPPGHLTAHSPLCFQQGNQPSIVTLSQGIRAP